MSTHIDAFKIGETKVVLSDDEYSETYGSVEYTQVTEAGTTRRDTVRVGFLSSLSITIKTDDTTRATFDSAVKQDSLTLTIWSEGASTTWACYISSYKCQLIRDTDSTVYWQIQATFSDLEAS